MKCSCCSTNHECENESCLNHEPEEEEREERREKIRNIVLLIWGSVCLVTAFILQKIDTNYSDISWSLFSDIHFYSSLSFIAVI